MPVTAPTVPTPPMVGIGWRQPHYAGLLQSGPALDFIEVHSENFFAPGGAARAVLRQGREHYPVSLHGVGLSLGSAAGLDEWHLDQLAQLVQEIEPVRVSDHASFARGQLPGASVPVHASDLLPVPFTHEALSVMCANVQRVQERLKRPIAVENLSAYLDWTDADLHETEFLAALARRTGCSLLVDLNNLYVNAQNVGLRGELADSPEAALIRCRDWLDRIAGSPVAELHLAGHAHLGDIVIDDHGSRVCAAVWSLYRHALDRLGAVPTLIEWDTDLPPLAVLLDEAALARQVAASLALPPAGRGARLSPLARQQQALLHALWTPPGAALPESTKAGFPDLAVLVSAPWQRGLAAYRANAHALAERALQAAFPVVAQLIGADSFALMAREFWQGHPPERGDIAWWGGALPGFLAGNPQLADVPYLADVAHVEWALHRIAGAADAQAAPASFALLGQQEPDTVTLRLPPGTMLYRSNWPVASLVTAHLQGEPAFDAVAAAVQARRGETALVWRQGLRPRLASCCAADAAMLQALLAGQPLLAALEAALAVDPQFDFSAWLNAAVAQGQVLGAACLPDLKNLNP